MSAHEMEMLKNMLRGYKRITNKMIRYFNYLGFQVHETGKHYKLNLPGGRCVVIAKTPSDFRAGENAYSVIRRVLESVETSQSA